jgi:HK97 gp10 family phage protein
MSKGFFIELDGLQPLIAKLKGMGKDIEEIVAAEIEGTAREIEEKAAQRVPKDTGGSGLAGAITSREVNKLNWEVVAQKNYAAYVEFGTGGLVDVPAGLEDYAIQFKGRGIKQINMRARPYLFPSYLEETRKLIKILKEELKAR